MHLPEKTSRFLHYLGLDRMVAPVLLRGIYWFGLLVILSAAIGNLFSEQQAFSAPLILIAAAITLLFWRLFCELLILFFNIHARLTEIRDLLGMRQARIESRKPIAPASLKSPRLNPLHKVQHD